MLELVIEAMVDAVLVVDSDGRIATANSGAAQLSGYTQDELRAMPIAQVIGDDTSGLRTVVRRRIEDGNVLRREESWLLAKDGARIPVSITGSPVVDASGALQGIVLVARDVREMRQLLAEKEQAAAELRAANDSIEQQLQEVRDMLLLAERRATLGTLAGGFGHELRNIAQIQVAAVDELQGALAEGIDLAPELRTLLPELERVGEHITLYGDKLMQLARPGPDHVAPAQLGRIVRDVVAMLRLAGKLGRVAVTLAVPPEPLQVTVNRTRIEQILVNLVTNAVDAIGNDAGTIAIDIHASSATRVACSVHDTGAGIAPEHLGRIFEPFFTTKGPERGTGLGLTVVKEIVASYGGALAVDSAPGRGTTITFELPR
ncbi:MAG TPA: ATP-binding protein [Kofleriaceae bacterium]